MWCRAWGVDVAARLAQFERVAARLEAEIAVRDGALIAQAERIAQLERLLEDGRGGGKRQGGPVLQGRPGGEPEATGP